ncbi:uncharacterized protein LOC144621076 [Crassostrea virginica]
MMNLSEDSQIVYPGTFVASLSNVDVVIDSNYDQEYHCDNLPPHLEDLFARSTEQLKVDERSALKNFLIKIDDSLDSLSGAKWFSTLDLCSGYWQVSMDETDKLKTAFATKRGNTFKNMLDNLTQVFDRLLSSNLKFKAKKCHLFSKTVEFLGHLVSEEGVSTDPSKVLAVKNWHHTCTSRFSKPFILDTDASDVAMEAVLSQIHDGVEKVIAYASPTLSKAERKYYVTRKELLAVVYFTKYYKHFLYGKEFKIRTDHSSLKWLLNCKNPEGQLARWFESLSNFQMTIEHRAGSKHRNADALSRIPCRKMCCLEAKSNVYSMACQSSESSTSLKAKQSEDKDTKQVLKWVASGVKPNFEELSSCSQRDDLRVVDEMLYKSKTYSYNPISSPIGWYGERFNKTLATMLSAYVDEHHADWDEHLPYVMMAYRAAVHETTGTTPHKMMLGLENATPLDIVYEMPSSLKRIPQNRWVWELQEKLDEAHATVRKLTKDNMLRQKWYHDRKLNWKSFKKGDKVYVYFPKRKAGTSPKFSSYWQGPFEIIEKCSNVTYKVNCGQEERIRRYIQIVFDQWLNRF